MTEVQSFQEEVVAASHQMPIAVDFWAEWCGPCRMLGPVLERLAAQAEGKWALAKVNVDQHPAEAQAYGIQGIPAVKLFFQGEVIAEFVGALPEAAVAKWLAEHLPSEAKDLLIRAKEARDRGAPLLARDLAERALATDPDYQDAHAFMADQLFPDAFEDALVHARRVSPGHAGYTRASAIESLCRLMSLAERTPRGRSSEWDAYLRAISAMKAGDYDAAITGWIDMIAKRQRDVDDDGARKAVIALFHWLGPDHALTQTHQRAFSSALF